MIFFLHENNLKHIGLWLCTVAILALLSACGQKGDLYLPEEPNDLVYASVEEKASPRLLSRTDGRENEF